MHPNHATGERCLRCRLKTIDDGLWNDKLARYGLIALTVALGVLGDRMIYMLWVHSVA
jgi:hypothetical protein